MQITRILLALSLTLAAAGCSKASSTPSPADDKAKPAPGQGFDDVQIETVEAGPNVYMLIGQGGNIGVLVGEDGVLIIDDQFEPLAPKIRAAIEKLSDSPVKFVINTHWHGDHTGGNVVFGKGATIVAHANVRKRLAETQNTRGRVREPLPKVGLPVVTYAQSVTLHFNGEDVQVVHMPTGHTDGDSIVMFPKAKVVHMGDHFFSGKFPFVDLESGGNPYQLEANIAKLLETVPPDAKLIPGHGPLSSVQDLTEYHTMLKDTIARVTAEVEAGKSLADVKKAGLPGYESWGTGFINTDKWIETIYTAAKAR